jgi:putative ABC transport system permease protein
MVSNVRLTLYLLLGAVGAVLLIACANMANLLLGATRGNLLRLVLGRAPVLAASGVAAGLVASFALTKLLANFLFGIKPSDPLTFLEVSALLLLVALAASFVPAVRATRLDPLVAMPCE